jgi:hypothetical protein
MNAGVNPVIFKKVWVVGKSTVTLARRGNTLPKKDQIRAQRVKKGSTKKSTGPQFAKPAQRASTLNVVRCDRAPVVIQVDFPIRQETLSVKCASMAQQVESLRRQSARLANHANLENSSALLRHAPAVVVAAILASFNKAPHVQPAHRVHTHKRREWLLVKNVRRGSTRVLDSVIVSRAALATLPTMVKNAPYAQKGNSNDILVNHRVTRR